MSTHTHSHGVEDLVVSCIDYRFRPRVAAWIQEELGDKADLVSVAGTSKAFLGDMSRDYILKQIDIASSLHGIKRVHLIDHIDCGAYGGSSLHENEEKETSFHADQCSAAQQLISEKFPDLVVKSYVLCFDKIVACHEHTASEAAVA